MLRHICMKRAEMVVFSLLTAQLFSWIHSINDYTHGSHFDLKKLILTFDAFVSMCLFFFSNQDKIALNRCDSKGHITQVLSASCEVYGRNDVAEGLLQFKHYWNKLWPVKKTVNFVLHRGECEYYGSWLCNANNNCQFVRSAILLLQISSPREVLQLCKCVRVCVRVCERDAGRFTHAARNYTCLYGLFALKR